MNVDVHRVVRYATSKTTLSLLLKIIQEAEQAEELVKSGSDLVWELVHTETEYGCFLITTLLRSQLWNNSAVGCRESLGYSNNQIPFCCFVW
jgi:hypothetical protein